MPSATMSVMVGPHGQLAKAQRDGVCVVKITPNFSFAFCRSDCSSAIETTAARRVCLGAKRRGIGEDSAWGKRKRKPELENRILEGDAWQNFMGGDGGGPMPKSTLIILMLECRDID